MDTRRNEQPHVEDVEGATFAAVIRPQPGGRSSRPTAPIVAALAIFAAGMLIGFSIQPRRPGLTAQATASPIIASPALSLGATNRPSASIRPTAQPTPSPTPLAGAWLEREFPAYLNVSPTDLWTVGGSFVLLGDTDGHAVFLSSADGLSWDPWVPSPAIVSYWAGTVVDGDLSFVATVTGVADTHFELVQTKDGRSMQSFGAAKGAAPDWVGFLDRVNGTWVMSHGQYLPDGQDGGGREDLQISDDGVRWTTIVPDGLGALAYRHAGILGKQLVVIADRSGLDAGTVALVTTDGRGWRSAPFPDTDAASASILDMACGASACVAVGTATQGLVDLPIAWVTTDGLHWSRVSQDFTRGTATTVMQAVVATDRGFLAAGGGEAWLSEDGAHWRNFLVMPATSGVISLLAAKGDRLLAFGEDARGVLATWLGSLAASGS